MELTLRVNGRLLKAAKVVSRDTGVKERECKRKRGRVTGGVCMCIKDTRVIVVAIAKETKKKERNKKESNASLDMAIKLFHQHQLSVYEKRD